MDGETAGALIWIGVALAAGIVEVLSLDLVFAMVAAAALVASGSSALGADAPAQLVVFAVASVALLVVARPPIRRHLLRSAPATLTGVAALVGRHAEVLADVTERGGRVKLAGETWSARTSEAGLVLPAEAEVVVVAIDGATAVCSPLGTAPDPSASALPPGA